MNSEKNSTLYNIIIIAVVVHKKGQCCIYSGSLVPRPFEGNAWGLLRAHARKISFIFRIIRCKISDNDVIVHGERARKEYADTFVYTVQ